ncbi:MAG TPA: metallophosphoesterase family protein [Bryobacteraceae bacterium]|nr:metallophosphoesterase family protein [Bryobacteraceae bacterium]
MRIAVLSDIHDNIWKLAAALDSVRGADALICCGDLCSPFIVHQMGRAFANPIHIVFGNNDGDLFRITANARKYGHIQIHGEMFRGELGGRRVAVNHYDNIARAIAASGEFDVVCFGHNHVYEVARVGGTLAINPGSIMGATFGADGGRTDVLSSFMVYSTESGEVEGYTLDAGLAVSPLIAPVNLEV